MEKFREQLFLRKYNCNKVPDHLRLQLFSVHRRFVTETGEKHKNLKDGIEKDRNCTYC